MKVEVFFGPDNTVTASSWSDDGTEIFSFCGQVEEVSAILNSERRSLEERHTALKAALARILYSLITWD